ncbi:MAG: HEAT repeat domain-containing protein [Myxococcota bacterium]|jgi:HEAT repeat protein|nr:HEAT repeat domain-containing protein [Myxococcota bacterium]
MTRKPTLPLLLTLLLLMVLATAEAWEGKGGPGLDSWEDAEGISYQRGDEGEQEGTDSLTTRRRKVLAGLPTKPDLLINLAADELPATGDLIRLGKTATPALVNGLVNSMSREVRTTCAAVLAETRDPAALEQLLDALDDPDEEVVSWSLLALGSMESRRATPRLLFLLRQPRAPGHLKRTATGTLGRLGDPAAVGPLLELFLRTWDPAAQQALWDLRRHLPPTQLEQLIVSPLKAPKERPAPNAVLAFAVERAGDLRLAAATPALQRLFETQLGLQNRIVYNLGRIGDRKAIPFLNGLLDRTAEPRLMNNVAFALQRLGHDVTPFLTEALADRRAYIRFNAAFVAGDLRAQQLAPALAQALQDPNDYVRSEVAVALGKIAAPGTLPALEAASREWNPIVRRDALLALASIDYPRYRERVLQELIGSPLRSVRARAVAFLADRQDPTVIPAVLATIDPYQPAGARLGLQMLDRFPQLDSPEATAFLLRVAASDVEDQDALRLLGRFADERARFALRQWAASPGERPDQLLRALGRFRDQDSEPLARRWLAQGDPAAQLHAAFLLASLGRPEGGERLLQALAGGPEEQKETAARLLTEVELGRVPGLEDGLLRLLTHDDALVRLSAARALVERGDPRAFQQLERELAKKVPFIQTEVLDLLRRAPRTVIEPVVNAWLPRADRLLRLDLEKLLAPS